MTHAIEAQVQRFAPGFRDVVLGRSAMGPRALEAHDRNLVGGDVNGGELSFRGLVRGHRTRRRGVYLCSASTAPGGGVHGLCGLLAARKALRDLRR
jgi:phytoene dehydrogenase-like protein